MDDDQTNGVRGSSDGKHLDDQLILETNTVLRGIEHDSIAVNENMGSPDVST